MPSPEVVEIGVQGDTVAGFHGHAVFYSDAGRGLCEGDGGEAEGNQDLFEHGFC